VDSRGSLSDPSTITEALNIDSNFFLSDAQMRYKQRHSTYWPSTTILNKKDLAAV
jgi:hypothetical protein